MLMQNNYFCFSLLNICMNIISSTAYLLFKVVVVGSSKCLMYTEIMCTCNLLCNRCKLFIIPLNPLNPHLVMSTNLESFHV